MNNLSWIGIVVGGLFIAGFGLVAAAPVTAMGVDDVQAQDVLFLMSGGLVTSVLGAAGLFGLTGQPASVAKTTK